MDTIVKSSKEYREVSNASLSAASVPSASITGHYIGDVAANFLATLDRDITEAPITLSEARRTRWKIDLTILPIVSITIILGAVDKIIIANAAIFGMRNDLHLVGNQYNWASSIFYMGFLAFDWPTAILIQRLPIGKLYAGLVLFWSIILFCTATTQNFAGLACVRFFLGGFEAGLATIASIITVMWYTKEEQPIRLAILFNQFGSSLSNLIAFGIGHTHTAIAQWRLLFITLASITFVWAFFMLLFLPDSPTTAWYFSKRQRYVCVKRIEGNNTGMEHKQIKWYQVRECLLDLKTWLLAIFAIAQNIPNGGIISFGAIILSGFGYDPLKTSLLNVPSGVIATAWQVLLAIPCSLLENRRCLISAMSILITMTSAILMWKLPRSNRNGLLGAYYVFYTYWAPFNMILSLKTANVSGHTKKVTMTTIYFLCYCLGNFIGPQLFRAKDAPSYPHGYIGSLCCLVVAIASIGSYGLLCERENRMRDRRYGPVLSSAEIDDGEVSEKFSDKTDKEKPEFRYIY